MKIAIIGAGASGMMAAATLVEFGVPWSDVVLFDTNAKAGKKVAITGWGRCNLTTGISSRKELLSKYARGADFLEKAIGAFPPKKVCEWFGTHGCPVYAQDDQRVFPVSDRGADVVSVFERIFAKHKVQMRFDSKVESILKNENGFEISFRSPWTNGTPTSEKTEQFDAVVIATGWSAYSKTGSDGSGHSFASAFGHRVTPLAPSLSAYQVWEDWCESLSGFSLAEAWFTDSEWKKLSEWAALFTHFWLTGPAVFALSARIAFETLPFSIRLVPDFHKNFEYWDTEISRIFREEGAKEVKNALARAYPLRFVLVLLALSGIAIDQKAASVSKETRRILVRLLSDGLPLTLVGCRPGEEFVTAGGVELSEVNPSTLESKLVENLYFTGEVLNVDAVTWGFNLQACWSTGRAAGKDIAHRFWMTGSI